MVTMILGGGDPRVLYEALHRDLFTIVRALGLEHLRLREYSYHFWRTPNDYNQPWHHLEIVI